MQIPSRTLPARRLRRAFFRAVRAFRAALHPCTAAPVSRCRARLPLPCPCFARPNPPPRPSPAAAPAPHAMFHRRTRHPQKHRHPASANRLFPPARSTFPPRPSPAAVPLFCVPQPAAPAPHAMFRRRTRHPEKHRHPASANRFFPPARSTFPPRPSPAAAPLFCVPQLAAGCARKFRPVKRLIPSARSAGGVRLRIGFFRVFASKSVLPPSDSGFSHCAPRSGSPETARRTALHRSGGTCV